LNAARDSSVKPQGDRVVAPPSTTRVCPVTRANSDDDRNSVHNGFPSSALKECALKQGPYDILYAAS
jgi:hypothetical protein